MEKRVLIIFIKNPILGKAKTRIAATEGDERALEIYEELLTHTHKVSLECTCERFVYYTYFIDEKDQWKSENFNKCMQAEGDLGQRMQAAFKDCLGLGAEKVLIIGSDCGALQASHIEMAFEGLANHDLVIGPAEDGGYYLMGMKKDDFFVFENKEWSTSGLLKATIKEIEEKQRSYHLLETLNDIDTIDDYNEWKGN